MLIENLDRLVVLAHYNEDLSWLSYLNLPYMLYTKSLAAHPNYIKENKGQEALCYFRYLIDAYPHFPRWSAFFHAHLNSYHQTYDTLFILNNFKWGKYEYVNVDRDDWYTTLNAHSSYTREYSWIADFWKLFAEEYLGPLPPEIRHRTCAQFVVSRARLTARPRRFYELCYEWLLATPLEPPVAARVFEYIWHIIMGEGAFEPPHRYDDFLEFKD